MTIDRGCEDGCMWPNPDDIHDYVGEELAENQE